MSPELRSRNRKSLAQAAVWLKAHRDSRLAFHLLEFAELPTKHAGVGLARKIGMDEAARRFDDLDRAPQGIVAGFDADCRCDPGYLISLEGHFQEHPRTPGCSIYFEHPLTALDPGVYEAIIEYELHLRYYVQALRFIGFPHAHHTIGSCMAVRAQIYKEQGGMNRRQAGEDFYFLNKIIPLGGFTDLTTTTVYPSARPSHRVPFGTGRAVRAQLEGRKLGTYPLQAFWDLKGLFDHILSKSGGDFNDRSRSLWPESVQTFLLAHDFFPAIQIMRANHPDAAAFRKCFFQWFNGFRSMKFLHHARDQYYGAGETDLEARKLLTLLEADSAGSTAELLQRYRARDRRPNQLG